MNKVFCKKNFIVLGIGALVLGGIYVGVSNVNSNSQIPTTTLSENKSETTTEKVIFDAKKFVGAKKQDVDVLLNITGTQDENEPYVYHYGDDTDVTFNDDGTCLFLCLDTEEKGYTISDENKILKSYGIDITNNVNKQSNKFSENYTQIKGFGEINVFHNTRVNESVDNISQIVFYTDSSKKAEEFLEKKAEEFEMESNADAADKKSSSNGQFTVEEAQQLIQSGKWKKDSPEIKAYIKKLKDIKWQKQNGIKNITKNIIVDIDQDGVCEMLLDNGSCEADLKVSVIMYKDGKIKIEHLSADHGGYLGYNSSKKIFFVGGGTQGDSYAKGYKLEGNQFKQVYSTSSDEGKVGEKNAHYTINEKQVSKGEYDEIFKGLQSIKE